MIPLWFPKLKINVGSTVELNSLLLNYFFSLSLLILSIIGWSLSGIKVLISNITPYITYRHIWYNFCLTVYCFSNLDYRSQHQYASLLLQKSYWLWGLLFDKYIPYLFSSASTPKSCLIYWLTFFVLTIISCMKSRLFLWLRRQVIFIVYY